MRPMALMVSPGRSHTHGLTIAGVPLRTILGQVGQLPALECKRLWIISPPPRNGRHASSTPPAPREAMPVGPQSLWEEPPKISPRSRHVHRQIAAGFGRHPTAGRAGRASWLSLADRSIGLRGNPGLLLI